MLTRQDLDCGLLMYQERILVCSPSLGSDYVSLEESGTRAIVGTLSTQALDKNEDVSVDDGISIVLHDDNTVVITQNRDSVRGLLISTGPAGNAQVDVFREGSFRLRVRASNYIFLGPALTLGQLVLEIQTLFPPDATAEDLANHVRRRRRSLDDCSALFRFSTVPYHQQSRGLADYLNEDSNESPIESPIRILTESPVESPFESSSESSYGSPTGSSLDSPVNSSLGQSMDLLASGTFSPMDSTDMAGQPRHKTLDSLESSADLSHSGSSSD